LPEESVLSDDFVRELINVGEVDILIGVPTYNDARTIGQVVQAIRAGLLRYFPRQRAAIINVDGGSRDNTQELVRAASISDLQHAADLQTLRTLHCISTQYAAEPSSGRALYAILASADLLHASACAVISADSTRMEPEWILRLLQPVRGDGCDLVSPVYRRHRFDGLLLRTLVYPMCRALYGQRIREPYPSEFAISDRLVSHFFGLDIWSQEVGRTGTELFLTILAITEGFKLEQVFLGNRARIDHAPADLVPAMRRTVGTLFWSMEENPANWKTDSPSHPVEIIGGKPEVTTEPLRINRKRLHELFVSGVAELEPILRSILSAPTLAELQRAASLPMEQFCYPNDLWVRTVYEFAVSYHQAVISRDHIIQALGPLYRGQTYTFLAENRDATGDEVERHVEELCLTFEHMKPYLLQLWDGEK
jgi:glucosylglycerate synthase